MTFPVPWLLIMIGLPLVGAAFVRSLRDPDRARQNSLIACGLTLACAIAAWVQHALSETVVSGNSAGALLAIDDLSAPLAPLVSLVYLLTVLATLRTKVRRVPFPLLLISQSILLATLSSQQPWLIIALLTAGTIPPWIELSRKQASTRGYVLYMVLFVAMLVAGQWLLVTWGDTPATANLAVGLLLAAVLLRSGIAPLHAWVTELFEQASLATALLFMTPMVGAYAFVRLVLPIAPPWALYTVAVLAPVTAIYAGGMALVQREARRFFAYMFLGNSSLVLVGLAMATPLGLTAGLCMWLAITLSMAGFGLTIRSVESRIGNLTLNQFHGLYEHTPGLAILFLVTGLASIGFPGTIGFIGAELLVDGAVGVYPLIGIAVVIVAALNGLAVLQAYFRVFTGTRHGGSIDLQIRLPERIAAIVLTVLVLGGGLYPQPGVASRYEVATHLIEQRQRNLPAIFAGEPQESAAPGLKELAPDWH